MNYRFGQIEYPLGVLKFGATSITQFPGGSLPLFIAHMDAVGRVITLLDYRQREEWAESCDGRNDSADNI